MREFNKYQSLDNKIYKIVIPGIEKIKRDYRHIYGKCFDVYPVKDDYIIMSYLLEIEENLLDAIDDSSKDRVLTRIGLLDIFNILDSGTIESTKRRRISYKEELGFEDSSWFIKYPKICLFREGEGKQFTCTLSELANKTKIPIDCEHCSVPEDFSRCEFLLPIKDRGKPPNVRDFSARCHLGKNIDPLKVSECLNRDCWKPIVMQSKALKYRERTMLKETLVSQCVNLIDYVNNLCNSKWSFKLFRVLESRAILDISTPCNSEDDFSKLILILGNLIDWIDIDGLKKNIKTLPQESGSINLLEQFLKEKNFPSAPFLIKRLRRIKSIGTKYPRHTDRPELLKDFRELDSSYPPDNWADVWTAIVRDFLVSLSELKESL